MKVAPLSTGVGLKHFVTCFERCAAVQKYEGGHVFYGYRPDFSSFHLKGVAGEGRGGGLSEVDGVMPSEVVLLLLSFI